MAMGGRPVREQEQFLDVVDVATARSRWEAVGRRGTAGVEVVPLAEALGRVLARDVVAGGDVPGFDRSNVDGYAVRARDTFGASEDRPAWLNLDDAAGVIEPGAAPVRELDDAGGAAIPIATGAMLPRGADAVVMVEHARLRVDEGEADPPKQPGANPPERKRIRIAVSRPVAPGDHVSFAGSDIAKGETVLWRGTVLTARETGILAAIGVDRLDVQRKPRVAILSTGDEIRAPGQPLEPGTIHDANATMIADAVRERGGEPIPMGIAPDDLDAIRDAIRRAVGPLRADLLVLSGGTSKGAGDLSHRVFAEPEFAPGLVVHGVALKPGKPVALGAVGDVPVAVLPGFPTSAIFTFHEFVAPRIDRLRGLLDGPGFGKPESDADLGIGIGIGAAPTIPARMAARVNSEPGRVEYLLVNLLDAGERPSRPGEDPARADLDGNAPPPPPPPPPPPRAYPLGKGSGSVTTFSRADGFVAIPAAREYVDEGELVRVVPLGTGIKPADLMVVGSHCLGLDRLIGRLSAAGWRVKTLWVGSQLGLRAVERGDCDVAGIHLLDPDTGTYNQPFRPDSAEWVPGYGRMQGLIHRIDDPRGAPAPPPPDFLDADEPPDPDAAALAMIEAWANAPGARMVNRNRGSGTRILIDRWLRDRRPPGHSHEARSHNAAAAAVALGRADWGIAIAPAAAAHGLAFHPLKREEFDFLIPRFRIDRPAVRALRALLDDTGVRSEIRSMGFRI